MEKNQFRKERTVVESAFDMLGTLAIWVSAALLIPMISFIAEHSVWQ